MPRTRHPAPAAAAAGQPAAPAAIAADWSRQQLAAWNESAAAVTRGLEVVRQIQLRAAREAAQRHAAAAARLRAAVPADVLAAQSELFRQDMDALVHCWQQTAAAAAEMNAELCACAMRLVNTEDALAAVRFLRD